MNPVDVRPAFSLLFGSLKGIRYHRRVIILVTPAKALKMIACSPDGVDQIISTQINRLTWHSDDTPVGDSWRVLKSNKLIHFKSATATPILLNVTLLVLITCPARTSETKRNYVGLYGVWVCVEMYVTMWDYLRFWRTRQICSRNVWHSMRFCGIVWVCMALYGTVCDCMGLYGTVWDCMGLYGTLWDCMRLYGTVWDCMGLYETV